MNSDNVAPVRWAVAELKDTSPFGIFKSRLDAVDNLSVCCSQPVEIDMFPRFHKNFTFSAAAPGLGCAFASSTGVTRSNGSPPLQRSSHPFAAIAIDPRYPSAPSISFRRSSGLFAIQLLQALRIDERLGGIA